jgi:branched-chain amino acid aminotransferase
MPEYTGLYYSENTFLKDIALLDTERFSSGVTLYEVIRIHDSICLFLEDHLQRLRESVHLSGFTCAIDLPRVHSILAELIRKNAFHLGNIKLVLHFPASEPPCLYAYFIPHAYPTPLMYAEGIETALFRAIRSNPNVKRILPEIREKVTHFIRSENLYEVLLVKKDSITEGSRSNVFFVKGEVVCTPPGNQVLKGITRKKVIELCNKLNYKLFEVSISTNQLTEMEAAFLTGTSPKILGIRKIGSLNFTVKHPIITSLTEAYDDLIANYIQQHSTPF